MVFTLACVKHSQGLAPQFGMPRYSSRSVSEKSSPTL